jgi:hypothetical protein
MASCSLHRVRVCVQKPEDGARSTQHSWRQDRDVGYLDGCHPYPSPRARPDAQIFAAISPRYLYSCHPAQPGRATVPCQDSARAATRPEQSRASGPVGCGMRVQGAAPVRCEAAARCERTTGTWQLTQGRSGRLRRRIEPANHAAGRVPGSFPSASIGRLRLSIYSANPSQCSSVERHKRAPWTSPSGHAPPLRLGQILHGQDKRRTVGSLGARGAAATMGFAA